MTDKIIGLDRKPYVAPPTDEAREIKVDASAVALLERMLERAKTGQLRAVAIIGLDPIGNPITSLPVHDDITFLDFALLNIAAETLKEQVVDCIHEYSTHVGIDPEGGEHELDDEGA